MVQCVSVCVCQLSSCRFVIAPSSASLLSHKPLLPFSLQHILTPFTTIASSTTKLQHLLGPNHTCNLLLLRSNVEAQPNNVVTEARYSLLRNVVAMALCGLSASCERTLLPGVEVSLGRDFGGTEGWFAATTKGTNPKHDCSTHSFLVVVASVLATTDGDVANGNNDTTTGVSRSCIADTIWSFGCHLFHRCMGCLSSTILWCSRRV